LRATPVQGEFPLKRMRMRRAFTLLELLIVIAVAAVLVAMLVGQVHRVQQSGRQAASTSNLRQFAAAANLYLADHDGTFFPYRQTQADWSVTWWFGHETASSLGGAEGLRQLDKTGSPLYPYLQQSGRVEVCPGFIADKTIWKPKYNGASCGYGYNVLLGGRWMGTQPLVRLPELERPDKTIIFATCAQVNTFQPPASPGHPLVEEFYGLDQIFKTVHFRFEGRALVLFVDGHVQAMTMYPGTEDDRIPNSAVGRVTPIGSMEMLR
jgi:prepilin-type N-terminal cleavage/methylation domain-containing protein/prepilin-type processing-associated H-X9-DG protein